MKPHEHCKFAGLKGLNHFSDLDGRSVATLINWHRDHYELFEESLNKAAKQYRENKSNGHKIT